MKGKRLRVDIPFVVADRDRHGNVRLYYRRKGKSKVRLFETPGTVEFARELEAAKARAEAEQPKSVDAIAPGSLRRLWLDYKKSTAFSLLDKRTQRVRELIIEGICKSKTPRGLERGALPYSMLPRHVEEIRDEKLDRPEAANSRVKALRQLYRWAVKAGRMSTNPAAEVGLLISDSDGFHTWTAGQRAAFEARHPVGTKARLAYTILLFTGVRRSDAVRLGPHMERDGALEFTEVKGAKSKFRRRQDGRKARVLPILPELRRVLDASAALVGPFAYLLSERGAPYTPESFGNQFRDWCREAGLPEGCAAHGLRKAGATIAAENGATEHQLMAIFGWDSPRQAEVYTRRANRRRLAASAMHLMVPQDGPENGKGAEVSHFPAARSVPPRKA